MTGADRVDVAVVGASLAGCTAARLFGQAGLRVALIERRPDPDAYKVTCTHAILSSGAPTIERLGLRPLLEARGAVRPTNEIWTPYGGWFRPPDDVPRGYGVTRRTLDPLLRGLAAGTPGVELLPGYTAAGVRFEDGRVTGVEIESPDHRRRVVHAALLVGADGRGSTVARLAGVRGRTRPHGRFFYFAYWRGARPREKVRGWMLDPDAAAQFPNEDDLTLLTVGPHRSRLAEFRADLEGAYARMISALPDAPDLSEAERVSPLKGKLEMPNVIRPAARPGLAFVGDAAIAADPLFGVGCGWAFQSSEWLVDLTARALAEGHGLDAALRRYRRRIAWRLGSHHMVISEFSSGRRSRPPERAVARAAVADPVVGRALEEVASRRRLPLRLLDARLLPRVVRAGINGGPAATA